ncbi:ATP-binding cassette domain-containing protein [Grimontia hollisae]|uniref:ATP-binding cassette domain-containing protein n=1 Tax=Grimontia hollisae TaxID=673 RepID=UPI0013030263|nr:ATP-binding cassette domain-containing protein [Grimontia hollisae]
MKNVFISLIDELEINCPRSLEKEILHAASEELIIKHIEKGLDNNLFTYKFFIGQITQNVSILSHFVISYEDGYKLIKYINGAYYDSAGAAVNLNDFLGCRYFELREKAKKVASDDLITEIYHLTPLWSVLLLLLTPFALVTPLYTNIFNTRLVYSNAVTTLFVVSAFFLMMYIGEFFAKRKIKEKCFKANKRSSKLFERYLFSFFPYFNGFSYANSLRTVEQYRKMVWDSIPMIASDALSFILLFIAMSVFLSWLSVYFLMFYAVIFFIFFVYRSKLYKKMADNENAANDMLKLRLSYIDNRDSIRFVNKFNLLKKYYNTYNMSLHYDEKISSFNFYWDELTKLVSFLALTLLFVLCFAGISTSTLNPAYMIVLFIISSRLSGLMAQIVTRLSHLKAGLYHLKQSLDMLMGDNITKDTIDDVGVKAESIDKIKLTGLTIKHDEASILENVSLKLKKGILYGLKGGVGTGKSTLMKTLIGSHHNYKGKIEYAGIDLNILDKSMLESKVSYLSADMSFFSGTLYDNFVFRGCNAPKTMDAILKECFPGRNFDYQNLYVDDIDNIPMSTGQKRKLLFLMAILSNADVYVLDESLVNLSPEDVVKCLGLLRKYAAQSIVILSSHNDSVLSACDVVLEIKDKTIIEHQ